MDEYFVMCVTFSAMGTKKIIVTQRHADCIGCGACTMAAPNQWEMSAEDGKAVLKGGVADGDVVRAEIDEADFAANQEAAAACPVQIISVRRDGDAV